VSEELNEAARTVADKTHRILEQAHDIARYADFVADQTTSYAQHKSRHPEEYPFTNVLDKIDYDLDLAESRMREVVGYMESAVTFADRLAG
jgi:hypothetical protein